MFDFDAGKLLIIGVIALIVIGPKDLPRVLRQLGQAVGRLRRMATEFQGQFMDAMKEADIQDIRNELAKVASDTELHTHFDPIHDIRTELTQAVTPSSAVVPASTPSVTDHFTLTPPPDVGRDDFSGTVASAGLAPVAETAELDLQAPEDGKKRKIIVNRNRGMQGSGRGVNASAPQVSRFRPVRPRRDEVAGS